MVARVCIDGIGSSVADARVSVLDRGFGYGDAVFEVLRVYDGRPFAVDAHLERLAASAERLGIPMPVPRSTLRGELDRTLVESGERDAYVRITLTRGSGPPGIDPATAGPPLRVVLVWPLVAPSPELYTRGIDTLLVRSSFEAGSLASGGAKVANYVESILAAQAARAAGCQEAIRVDTSGQVLEGATSNVFVVRDGHVATPPRSAGILPGITRGLVLELARGLGLPARERLVLVHDLNEADEIFVTSSIREIVPVVRVDGRPIAEGLPGSITARLLAAYRSRTSLGD